MMTTRVNTGKYRIPLKLRKPLHISHPEGFKPQSFKDINIEELNDTLELINDNYDTFKTIFTAPDDINVNKEIKQEAAGMILSLLNPKVQTDKEPIRLPEYKYKPWPKDLASFIRYSSDSVVSANDDGGAFDAVEYNKNKGEWRGKNINDFKQLFD